ncbi:SAM-dependent methyltransferase [Candidatus Woesearchaeota archaeon CG10_big_fil_rev_8_21_14_0_10_34_8]|nr:MAG: SAM-dependent methyltransferase [Candidatus Woesearchaeota archaeon CG10_big_fil_rev_8_21_14_0_10_34_8]
MDKLLIDLKGRKYLFKGKDMHTKDGFISADEIKKAKLGTVLKTNKDVLMTVLEASFLDKYWKIKRGAQIIPIKDLGFIAAEVGLGKDWVVVDSGSGSGGSALFFANLCKKVYTYDIREDHLKIVEHNIEFLGLKNIVAKLHDIYSGIPVKDVDMVLLDLPSPWEALEHAKSALKNGGWIVSYSPCIPQVMDFVEKVRASEGLLFFKACEITEQEWDVNERKVRPKSQAIGHSGFLTFVRKI